MKQTEIFRGNKLIAEFLNENVDEDFIDSETAFFESPFKYDIHWGCLMRAVEKIESLGFRFGIALNSVDLYDIISQRFSTTVNVDESYGIKNESFKKIESTWLAVVEFIKWYNKQD